LAAQTPLSALIEVKGGFSAVTNAFEASEPVVAPRSGGESFGYAESGVFRQSTTSTKSRRPAELSNAVICTESEKA
jgi:hypothetical protein